MDRMEAEIERKEITEKDLKPRFRGKSALEIEEEVLNEAGTDPVSLTG